MMARGKPTVNQMVQSFENGDRVHYDLQPNIKGIGYPYIMFKGLTGEVVAKRGDAYVVHFMDKNKKKILITKPVHLKKAGVSKKTQ